MKKFFVLIQLTTLLAVYSSSSYASGGGHGKGHHKNKHHQYQNEEPRYYPQPETRYYLAGGVVGSVLGYEIGKGDPIATGLGAAAGSYLGNGIAGGR
ncbi:MAG: hypothetical protein CG438_799 [Methylococcaceae bacterium NSP1-1]|nr:MAG: hypothetical protein CG438_799 [Methylococcaceae bacterium NSP1-1]